MKHHLAALLTGWAVLLSVSARAQEAAASAETPPPIASTPATATPDASAAVAPEDAAFTKTLREELTAEPAADVTDEERKEHEALLAFYDARAMAPLFVGEKGYNDKGRAIAKEIDNAGSYGLDPAAFPFPYLNADAAGAPDLTPEAAARAEAALARAILKYARFARGGRITAPSEQLNSNLDRRPQFLGPRVVLDEISIAPEPGVYLAKTNPQHPQFERLREKYLAMTRATTDTPKRRTEKASASSTEDRLLANMEMWRWMPEDLGSTYMMANVPEFMIRLVKDGETVHTERVVAGEIGKQTTIFSRPLKSISFRPLWRVPESIKVRELWPSLLRGGGLMRSYGLELQTKDGASLDYRTIDWAKADIREYEVVQPPGKRSVLGVVKFNFPSQHTIFMHDTPDKWMFNSAQRTLSHGCLRLRNPLRMAELILAGDKGWDSAKISELATKGPLNNEVMIDSKVRMHITYFTAWVGDDGKLKTYPDVYGHEKRVTQALKGKWTEIAKGKDHLAPVEINRQAALAKPVEKRGVATADALTDFMNNFTGGGL